tara:strand:+ start:401 stop:778 length:378 start_codon:yes stop_codon:yes gene_type:complete
MKNKLVLLFVLLSTLSYSQRTDVTSVPEELFGIWQSNGEDVNEFLEISSTLDGKATFVRKTSTKILAAGYIVSVINNENPKGQLRVQRVDTSLEYDLGYFIGNDTFVVTQPNSQRAWLWVKRIDY